MRLASFDIGRINFAQYVEEFDSNTIFELEKRYKDLPKKLRRRVKGPMNSRISDLLTETVLSGKRIQTGVYNFTVEENQKFDIRARLALICHLAKYEKIWDSCDIFIIEQQFFNASRSKKGGVNVDAIKVGEATFIWLLDRYPFKTIMYFGSNFKTQIFGAPWKMTKATRKNWAISKTEEFYKLLDDEEMIKLFSLAKAVKYKRIKTEERVQEFKDGIQYKTLSRDSQELADKIIKTKQKLDDISDAFMQAQAFKFRMMVGCF